MKLTPRAPGGDAARATPCTPAFRESARSGRQRSAAARASETQRSRVRVSSDAKMRSVSSTSSALNGPLSARGASWPTDTASPRGALRCRRSCVRALEASTKRGQRGARARAERSAREQALTRIKALGLMPLAHRPCAARRCHGTLLLGLGLGARRCAGAARRWQLAAACARGGCLALFSRAGARRHACHAVPTCGSGDARPHALGAGAGVPILGDDSAHQLHAAPRANALTRGLRTPTALQEARFVKQSVTR